MIQTQIIKTTSQQWPVVSGIMGDKMARDDYFVIAAKILDYLYRCLKKGIAPDPEQLSPDALEINESYWSYIFSNLMELGYIIIGVTSKRLLGSAERQVKIQYNRIQITPAGIEYLMENSTMKKALETLQTIKDLIPFI